MPDRSSTFSQFQSEVCRPRLSINNLRTVGMRVDTVAIGVDFSGVGNAAATWVAKSLTPDAKIALVYAIELPVRPPFLAAETIPSEALEIDARAEREDELRQVARGLGRDVTRTEVRVGRSAEVIAQ